MLVRDSTTWRAHVVTHIVSVTVYSLLGAFQFVPSLRGRRGWHGIAGRILIPAGLLAALSGLWMSAFYPLPAGDGIALFILRLVFGSAMLAGIVLGLRGDSAPGLRCAQRVDDSRLCHRRRRGNAGPGGHPLDAPCRPDRRTDPGGSPGVGMGHQPGGGRTRHLSALPAVCASVPNFSGRLRSRLRDFHIVEVAALEGKHRVHPVPDGPVSVPERVLDEDMCQMLVSSELAADVWQGRRM